MMHETHNFVLRAIIVFSIVINIGLSSAASPANETDFSPLTVYACEGNEVKIECRPGLKIQIMRSNYGRLSLSVCSDGYSTEGWKLDCTSARSLPIVIELCDNKSTCSISATNDVHGDACTNTFKYLEVVYICIPGGTTLPVSYASETYRLPRTRSTPPLPSADSTQDGKSGHPRLSTTPVYSPSGTDKELGPWCEEETKRGVAWPRTAPGQVVMMACPNNPAVRKAIWRCGVEPVEWINEPDLSQCTSHMVAGIVDLVKENGKRFSDEAVSVIASDLKECSSASEPIYGGDLLSLTTAMQKVTAQLEKHIQEGHHKSSSHLVHEVSQAVFETSSNLLNESRIESWKDIPSSLWPTVATTMLSTVEKCAIQTANITTRPTIVRNVKTNLVVEIRVINITEDVSDQVFPQNDSSVPSLASVDSVIQLTGNTVQDFGVAGLTKVVFATYNNIDKWLKTSDNLQDLELSLSALHPSAAGDSSAGINLTDYVSLSEVSGVAESESASNNTSADLKMRTVNTRIISASFVSNHVQRVALREPVVFIVKHLEEHASNATCAFWNYSKLSMKGSWSTQGCRRVVSNSTHTHCACDHLTNFAVLMSINEQKLTDIQKFSLSFLTYFGCILSIICLVIAFLTFQFFKNLQCDRNTIHKNLVLNLCIAEAVFLIGIIQYETPTLCAIIAGVLHYLFLVTFLWMCLEGVQLYIMLVEVFEAESSRVKWFYLSAYGIPAVIVIISAIVNSGGYGTASHCWLSTDKGFIWAFVAPVLVIICINSVMLGIAIYVMCTHVSNAVNVWKARQKTTLENIRSWIKGAVVLVVLLGLTWFFGLLYINEQSVAMAYIFTALNSTQGVFIFVFHCLMNEKVQKEYKRWVRHRKWLPEDLRVRCGGVRSSASITPTNTSSTGKIIPEPKNTFEYLARLFTRNVERKRSSTTSLPSSSHNNNNNRKDYKPICRNSDSKVENESSQMYSEPTEDPFAYMDSVNGGIGQDEEFYLAAGDISVMEGSVADTDYLDDYTKRATNVINVDKYMIQNPTVPNGRVTATLPNRPAAELYLKNAAARRSMNEKRAAKEPEEQVDPFMSFTNLGVNGNESKFPNRKVNLR